MALDPNRPLTPAEIAELKKLYEDLRGISNLDINLFEQSLGSVKAVRQELENLRKEQSNLNSDVTYFYEQLKKTIAIYAGQNNALDQIKKSYNTLDNLVSSLKQDQDGISRLSKKELETIVSKVNLQRKNLQQAQQINADRLDELNTKRKTSVLDSKEIEERKKLISATRSINALLYGQIGGLLEIENAAKRRLQIEKTIITNLGGMGLAYKGIQKTLSNLGVESGILERMNDRLAKLAGRNKIGFKELFMVTKRGFKEAFEDPMFKVTLGLQMFKSGINDIKKAFDIFKEYNGIFVENARVIGLSTEQMTQMVKQASLAQSPFQQNMFSAKQIAEAIAGINQQLGLSVEVSTDTANEFASMTNSMGLSVDEATNIYKLSALNNKSLQDTNKLIASQVVSVQKSTGIQINARQVYQEIGKLNAGITAKFQQNPELIARAVAQAKALGTTLEDIDKIGESLLNWESSIENELKAELITGRQLNFERARAAALTGDQATLMAEVANQAGSLADFQGMNVIAQKSLADAFGMSREEMADMLRKQEVFNKLGDVSGKSAAEQLKIARERGISEEDSLVLNLKQQSAAETLAATFDSLKIILADLVSGPFGDLVKIMGSLAKNSWIIYGALGAMAGLSLVKLIGGLTLMVTQLSTALATAITLEGLLTAGAALIAIPALLGIAYGIMSSIKSEAEQNVPQAAEGGIVPATPGGRLVNVGEGGKDEAIIPLNSSKGNSILGGGNIDFTPMINAINKLEEAINKMASRPSVAYINGRDAFANELGRTPTLGTSQNQSSYNLA
jgi:hypothetical protein